MHFDLPLCAAPPYNLAVLIFKVIFPDVLLRILPRPKPPEVADKDRWYTASLSRSHGAQ